MSRYYNPEIGRWVNADVFISTGQGVIGYNMYAYCNNNPVIYVDRNGEQPEAVAAWAGTMWWLCGIDGVIPIGDIVYGGGIVILGLVSLGIASEIELPEIMIEAAEEGEKKKEEQKLPDVTYPGDDPTKSPGDDYEWKGKEPVGGDEGTWKNKNTGEQLHPDLKHQDPIGPHWDYTNGRKPKKWWRIFPDGTIRPKI